METDFAFKRQHIRMVSTNDRSHAHRGRAGGCFHFSPLYEDCGTKFPAKQRLGFGWKKRRKTANACDSNAIEMRTESTAYFILAAKNAFTEVLVSWRNRAVNVGNRTGCEFLQVKLSLDRPGLGATLESTQARCRRDRFAIAFAAYRMPRALITLLPEDHRSVEKQSCKRQDNNGRPKYQNVCISFWSAAFVFDSVLAIERAV